MIWAIVLAAGESRRMGTQKLLLPYGETTVVETVVRKALDSGVDRVMAVVGADRDTVLARLERYPLTIVENENFRQGMLTSVQAGFAALPADAVAAVVMLGDQPAVPTEAVRAVVRAARESGEGIIIPTSGGRRGHPVLVATKYGRAVASLDPAIGLRQLRLEHPDDVLEVEVGDPAVLRDLDTPEDYEREKRG
ncbi:MAG: nucleotidyltransferase family protein [Candidatus Aminicenantes bacterium]|nr:nucleotidyltransferase family protein [Candidatus Aminicenantes bacterium]